MPVTTISHNIPAASCPPLVVDATLPSLTSPVPQLLTNIVSGTSVNLASAINKHSVHTEILARGGGGAFAIDAQAGNQFAISDPGTGLNATVGTGRAFINGVVQITASTNRSLTDNAQNYLWLLQNSTINNTVGSTAAPSTKCVYLGRVTTAGGVITAIDRSGVLFICGNTLYRRTGDTGTPVDYPPASYIIITRSAGGFHTWMGPMGTYWSWPNDGTNAFNFASADNSGYIAAL